MEDNLLFEKYSLWILYGCFVCIYKILWNFGEDFSFQHLHSTGQPCLLTFPTTLRFSPLCKPHFGQTLTFQKSSFPFRTPTPVRLHLPCPTVASSPYISVKNKFYELCHCKVSDHLFHIKVDQFFR